MIARHRIVWMLFAVLIALPILAPVARGQAASTPAVQGSQATPPVPAIPTVALPAQPVAPALLPQDLSPWGMFLSADRIVKVVMVGLALASVLTWTVWLAKGLELFAARRRLRLGFAALASARSLTEALQMLGQGRGVARRLLDAALEEWRQSADALDDREGVKERVASHLGRIEAAVGRRMIRGTGLLATIGATSPFVGLFGTVWGIMNSFVGISKAHTTNLAVVAPGIAEALLATACGLVAAIPAVIIYNHFARRIAAAVLRLVSRDLSRGERPTVPHGALHVVAE